MQLERLRRVERGGTGGSGPAQKGGTLYILNVGPHDGLDPQQSYGGPALEFASRVYARSLVTFSTSPNAKMIPDLATDTGTMTDKGKTWKFTMKGDAKWQDGKPVTCDDVKYGISRTFATDVISNGADIYPQLPRRPAEGGRQRPELRRPLQGRRSGQLQQGRHL